MDESGVYPGSWLYSQFLESLYGFLAFLFPEVCLRSRLQDLPLPVLQDGAFLVCAPSDSVVVMVFILSPPLYTLGGI
jgi:hypothetical protein